MNNITWLLVADSSKARLFSLHKARLFQQPDDKELLLIAEFNHEKSRRKGTELVTDKMGEFGSGTFVENTSAKEHEAEQFALELLNKVEFARKEGHFRDIILVAPPAFMGLLHKNMSHETQKFVSKKIEKDYTQLNVRELLHNLLNHI